MSLVPHERAPAGLENERLDHVFRTGLGCECLCAPHIVRVTEPRLSLFRHRALAAGFLLQVALIACRGSLAADDALCVPGTEGCSCDVGECEPGLTCLSELCVDELSASEDAVATNGDGDGDGDGVSQTATSISGDESDESDESDGSDESDDNADDPGPVIWQRRFDFGLTEAVQAVGVLRNGSVVFTSGSAADDIVVRALTSTGGDLWSITSGAPDATGLAIGVTDVVTVVGVANRLGEPERAWVGQFDHEGALRWVASHHVVPNRRTLPAAVTTRADTVTYVVGTVGEPGVDQSSWLQRFDQKGELKWTYTIPDSVDARAVATDDQGNAFVVGQRELDGSVVAPILRVGNDGAPGWSALVRYDLWASGWDIVMSPRGSLAFAGSAVVDGVNATWVQVYGTDGAEGWGAKADHGGLADCRGIAAGPEGDFYVAISEHGDTVDEALVLRKYDAAGHGTWTRRYPGVRLGGTRRALVSDGEGNIIVIGVVEGAWDPEVWVAKIPG